MSRHLRDQFRQVIHSPQCIVQAARCDQNNAFHAHIPILFQGVWAGTFEGKDRDFDAVRVAAVRLCSVAHIGDLRCIESSDLAAWVADMHRGFVFRDAV